jgi:glutathione S-transferase
MDELILHHYPQSPVSEKIRKVMGFKKLPWRSVEQNRFPDRPQLFLMTGGYRRLPVLQVGADIYCDTHCILRELERRFPAPSLFPNDEAGLSFALARWTDGPLFDLAMRVSFAPMAQTLPAELVADRARLYLGSDGDFQKEVADLPHTLAQLRPQLGWLDDNLASGGEFMLGSQPGLVDILAWFIVWFLRGRHRTADALLGEFPQLCAWADRIDRLGHGTPTSMSAQEALEQARGASPRSDPVCEPDDPQDLRYGMQIAILPLSDTGEAAIMGSIVGADRNQIAIQRHTSECGTVVIHFPRVGYRIVTP